MKTKILLSTLLLIIIFFSCNKDDSNDKICSFNYQGIQYETPNGYYFKYNMEGVSGSVYQIYLSSCSYDVQSHDFINNGNINLVEFIIHSPSETELSSESYSYKYIDLGQDWNEVFVEPTTFTSPGIMANKINWDDEIFGDENSSGNIDITNIGEDFEFNYNFTLDNGKVVEGYFKGKLNQIE